MTSPLKSSDFNPPHPFPLLKYVLNASPLSNRTSRIATTPCPLMESISCHLSYSLQGNILSTSSHDIHPPPPFPPSPTPPKYVIYGWPLRFPCYTSFFKFWNISGGLAPRLFIHGDLK